MKKDSSKGLTQFWIFTALTIIASVLDNFFTYLGSPDLSREANPIVYTFGYGWSVLITVNVIIISIIVLFYYYSFVRFKPDVIKCNDFKEYKSMLYFNCPDKFKWTLYKLPKNKRVYFYLLACVGYIFAIIIPVMRFRFVLEWMMFLYNKQLWDSYCRTIQNIAFNTVFGRIDVILIAVILAIILYYHWFNKQYKINQQALI